jgi:hypothetical protein
VGPSHFSDLLTNHFKAAGTRSPPLHVLDVHTLLNGRGVCVYMHKTFYEGKASTGTGREIL